VSKLTAFWREWVSLSQDFSGKGSSLGNIFLVSRKLNTFCYRQCKLNRATCSGFDTIPACDRRTDRRTELLVSTALAMRALRRAVKKIGRSTDGGGSSLKFFKIILF